MRILIDTSVLVDIDRGVQKTAEKLKEAVTKHTLYISIISVEEILTGANLCEKPAIKKARELLNQFEWITIDARVAEHGANIRSHLIRNRKKAEYPDILIAACYLAHGCDLLVTHNLRDFANIPGIQAIAITSDKW